MNPTETAAPSVDEMRIAAIEATGIGMKALGKDYSRYSQISPLKQNSTYRGSIVGENKHFVVQKVSALNTVRHAKQDLPLIPKVGSEVRISYSNKQVKITDEMKHDRKRTHRISL